MSGQSAAARRREAAAAKKAAEKQAAAGVASGDVTTPQPGAATDGQTGPDPVEPSAGDPAAAASPAPVEPDATTGTTDSVESDTGAGPAGVASSDVSTRASAMVTGTFFRWTDDTQVHHANAGEVIHADQAVIDRGVRLGLLKRQ